MPINYGRPSVRHDGRILAVETDRGVVLWDLAHGTELGFLGIGLGAGCFFEESGDLLTHGSLGVLRWPVQVDDDLGAIRIGPPSRLPLPPGRCEIAEDRHGRVIALANRGHVPVLTPHGALRLGPLDDVRGVAVSPDGEWVATSSFSVVDVRLWRTSDGREVFKLPIDYGQNVRFSADGRWLMTGASPCRLWVVGTWQQAWQVGGAGLCFSADSRMLAVQDASKIIRLVETTTGRTLAALESPDLCHAWFATFSPDGSRLVVTTREPRGAAHVWDLRAIRKHLAEMGLDWDAPPYSEDDPADPSARTLPPIQFDYGRLRTVIELYNSHLEESAVPALDLVARYTERLKAHPDDADALHWRGHALRRLERVDEALADFTAASARRPSDGHLHACRGMCLFALKRYAPALDELESAFRTDPETVRAIFDLDRRLNDLAWGLATGPEPERDPALAARMAAFSVALVPGEQVSLNTLGVALYRAGKFAEAITTLEKSLAAGKGQFDAFDLLFLAMAHHRLGHRPEARDCYERAVHWVSAQKGLAAQHAKELADFRAEAEAVLAGPSDELPADVFAQP